MTLTRKIWLFLAALGILLLGSTWWLLGTDSGARWALARAANLLPQELAIGATRGSLLSGIRFRTIDWHGDSVRISASDVFLDVQLVQLLFRYVVVDDLNVGRFDMETRESGEADDATGLPTIDLPVDISISRAHLRNVSYRSDSFAQTADEIRLAASLFGPDLSVTRLELAHPDVTLNLNGRVKLADFYSGRTRVAWRWRQSDTLLIAGDLELQGDMRRYELQHSLTSPISLSTSGSISFESGRLLADLRNEWQSLELSFGERRLDSSAGSLHLRGSIEEFEVDLQAHVRVDELPETQIELSGTADPEAIRISHLLAVNEIGHLTGTGNATWRPEQTFDLDFSLSGLDPSRISPSVGGTLEFEGHVAGRVSEQAPEVDLRIDRMGGNVNGHLLAGDALVTFAQNTLAVTDARLMLGANSAGFSGSFGEMISLDTNFDLPALAELLPEASGALRGHVTIGGSRDRPDARVDLSGDALQWAEYSVGELSIDASVLQTERGFVELQLTRISIGGTSLDSAQVSASGELDAHSIRLSLDAYDSELLVEAGGGLSQGSWSGRVASLAITNALLGRWASREESDLFAAADEIVLSETCLFPASGSGRACFGGSYEKEKAAALDLALTGVPLAAIPVTLPGDVKLSGYIDARSHIENIDSRLTGSAEVELREAMVDASYEGETIAVSFSDAVGQATISDNRVESTLRLEIADGAGNGNLNLVLQDMGESQSAISGQGNVSVNDVSLFAVFLPGISNPAGKIMGGLTISGTLARPEFMGEIALTEGAFAVRQTGVEILDIDVRLSQRAPGRLQLAGSARSGGGQISIQGDTLVGTDSGIRTELVLSGDNFELARLPNWQVAASPSITAIFDERATVVSGELGIPAASITVNEVPETAASPSPDAVVHRPGGAEEFSGRRLAIDVTTTLGDEVYFSGFGLTAGLEGAVRLQGGTRQPYVGTGTLVLRGGRYKVYGQELEIERGELLFNGPLDNPRLDIRAIRRTSDVVAGIQLSGTPSQLQSEVFSEPILSDAEALSYLLTGRPLASTAESDQGDILNNAAFALGLSGAGTVASQIRSGVGLETLSVEGGSDSGRIVAGKRIGSRLLVEYGYGLIDKLGTLLLRYQLTDRIVLESRTGTVSNLDVVYSVKKQ